MADSFTWRKLISGGAKAFGSTRTGTRGDDVAVARRRLGNQRFDERARGGSHLGDRLVEGGLIGLGGFSETRDLAHKLQRSVADLVFGSGRLEVKQRFDIAA